MSKRSLVPEQRARARRACVGLGIAAGLWLGLLVLSSGAQTASAQTGPTATPTPECPPGQFWDPFMTRCVLIRQECPAGKIDVTGDGTVCEALDSIPSPSHCIVWPAGPNLPPRGAVECALPLRVGGEPLQIGASVGCLNVTRRPFPRAMVNLPVDYRVTHIIPPAQLSGIGFGEPGSYRLSALSSWATEGLFLHERYGYSTVDNLGQAAFNTRALLAGDPYPYPSVNNVRARLLFRMATSAGEISWTTAGFSDIMHGGLTDWARTTYVRSSFPLPGSLPNISPLSPAVNRSNTLPAFKLALHTRWDLYLLAEWDEFSVNDAHEYVWSAHQQVEVPVAPAYMSYRAWDNRQSVTGASGIYCNAAQGYIPVPVVEAQTVLK